MIRKADESGFVDFVAGFGVLRPSPVPEVERRGFAPPRSPLPDSRGLDAREVSPGSGKSRSLLLLQAVATILSLMILLGAFYWLFLVNERLPTLMR